MSDSIFTFLWEVPDANFYVHQEKGGTAKQAQRLVTTGFPSGVRFPLKRSYSPLKDHPGLFREFAEIGQATRLCNELKRRGEKGCWVGRVASSLPEAEPKPEPAPRPKPKRRVHATPAPAPSPRTNLELASTGSGFYVSGDGHVVTNEHVVDGCTRLRVWGADKTGLQATEASPLATSGNKPAR